MSPIPLHLAVEDDLSETVIRRLLLETDRDYVVGRVLGRGGFGYLKSKANNWNAAAASGTPVLVLADLDQHSCPSGLIDDWLDIEPHANLIFRVAIREVESWLLADREGLADFLHISPVNIPFQSDLIADPKQCLINLARRSRVKALRESIVPRQGSTAIQGPDYNGCLSEFVRKQWDRAAATKCSPSLHRAFQKFMNFQPDWIRT